MAGCVLWVATLCLAWASAVSATRVPKDVPRVMGDGVTPESARSQIQALLSNFSAALRANDTAGAAEVFAASVALYPPGAELVVVEGAASQGQFLSQVAGPNPVHLQLTVADIVLGSAPAAADDLAGGALPLRKSASLGLWAVARLNYVAFTASGALADVGKAVTLWNGTATPSPSSGNGDKKAYTWRLVQALWTSDVEAQQRVSTRLQAGRAVRGGAGTGGTEPELAAAAQGVLDAFATAIASGDIVGASHVVAPCLELLPPGHPRSVISNSLDLTRALQTLVRGGKKFSTQVLKAQGIVMRESLRGVCGVVSANGNEGGQWIVASGVLNETNSATGEVLRSGKFIYTLTSVPKDDLALGDKAARYVIQSASWNFDGPAPADAPEDSDGGDVAGGVSPVVALEQLRASLSDLTEAIAANDTSAAAAQLGRTAFVLAPGHLATHLTTADEKEGFFACLHAKKYRFQLTIVDVAVGKPKAFTPIPSANSNDLVALTYVNYVAFTAAGSVADVGKLMLLWFKDGLVTSPGVQDDAVTDAPSTWKLYWIAFNSDVNPHARHAAFGTPEMGATEEAMAGEEARTGEVSEFGGDVKPEMVLQQLSSAVEQVGAALTANNTFVAAMVFAPSALLLLEESPAQLLSTQDEKEALFQRLVDQGLTLTEDFEEIVLADLSFFSDSSRDVGSSAAIFAITRGTYTISSTAGNGSSIVEQGHAVQVWTHVGPKTELPPAPQPSYAVRWALVSHIPLQPEEDARSSYFLGQSTPTLGSPKPDTAAADLHLALKNLSLAACPDGADAFLSIIGPNVTVLAPGAGPDFLNNSATILAFFNSSFLPCGVRFIVDEVAVGSGAFAPEPAPTPAGPEASGAANGDDSYLAVTKLVWVDYESRTIGKAVALWTMAGKVKEGRSAASNDVDHYLWNLTVIGWSSDFPDASPEAFAGANTHDSSETTGLTMPTEAAPRRVALEEVTPLEGLGSDSGMPVWPGLQDSLDYFTANITAGDVENATLLFTSLHLYTYMEPGSPPTDVLTPADRTAFTEQFLGLEFNLTVLSAWQLSVKESSMGLADRGQGNAFSIVSVVATKNDTYVLYGHSLMLWDAVTAKSSAYLGSSKAAQFAIRWEHFTPMEPPASAPAPAPAPAAAPATAPAAAPSATPALTPVPSQPEPEPEPVSPPVALSLFRLFNM